MTVEVLVENRPKHLENPGGERKAKSEHISGAGERKAKQTKHQENSAGFVWVLR